MACAPVECIMFGYAWVEFTIYIYIMLYGVFNIGKSALYGVKIVDCCLHRPNNNPSSHARTPHSRTIAYCDCCDRVLNYICVRP